MPTFVIGQPSQGGGHPTHVAFRELVVGGVGHQQAQGLQQLRQDGGVWLCSQGQQQAAVQLPHHAPDSHRVRGEGLGGAGSEKRNRSKSEHEVALKILYNYKNLETCSLLVISYSQVGL